MPTYDTPNSLERLAADIDEVEADLVRLQSKLWRVRQRIQDRMGKKVGYQYDEPTPVRNI
jgi:tetrahydromethanopterin S-methyltransferase subunit G